MLLAEVVGPSGLVVAIDREARAVETTRSRAEAAGHRNIEAVVATDDDIPVARPFDAALGRNVLPHQRDPVTMIRRAASAVRPGESSLSTSSLPISQTGFKHFQASPSTIKSSRP